MDFEDLDSPKISEAIKRTSNMLDEFFEINDISPSIACQSMMNLFLSLLLKNETPIGKVNKILDHSKKAYKDLKSK